MDYDILVIGAGPGGYVAAIKAARLGAKTAIIEEKELGGTCLNRGCIPTKALLEAGDLRRRIAGAKSFGITTGEVKVDYSAVVKRTDQVVDALRKGVGFLLKKNGVEHLQGRACLKSANAVELKPAKGKTASVTAEQIVLATGSRPAESPALPFDGKVVISSTEAIWLKTLPGNILIVGGGYIGCEFACLFSDFGVGVTVVEMTDSLLPGLDADVSKELLGLFKRKKVKVLTGQKVEQCSAGKSGAKVKLADGKTLETDLVLVCTGRKPNTEDIGLEDAGVELDERGFVKVNDRLCTTAASVRAIGDVNGKFMLAHVASHQGLSAVQDILEGEAPRINYDAVPACVFTHPTIATAGMTEARAREVGREVAVSSFPVRALGKALASGETTGFVKLVADAQTGQVLGAHMIGTGADLLIAEATLAIQLEATARELAHTIHAHPTIAEGVMEAAAGIFDKPIHT